MLKQLTVSMIAMVLGVGTLAASTAPAAADRGKARVIQSAPVYEVQPRKHGKTAYKQKQKKPSFESTLDLETEAVWRNLRPNRFDDY